MKKNIKKIIGKKVIPIEVNEDMHLRLKLLATKLHTSMNVLCREGIEYIFKKYEEKNSK